MKFLTRAAALLLICSTLFLACACASEDEGNGSESWSGAASDTLLQSETTTEKPTTKPTNKATTSTTNATEKEVVDPYADEILDALQKAASGTTVYSVAVSTEKGIKVRAIKNDKAQNTYSVSKVFCVTAIGMLYDEGKIKTSDTIGEIFKDELKQYGITDGRWDNITVHDVLKHNVGFKKENLLDVDADPGLMTKHNDFLKVTLSYELDGKKTNRYTDAAYYLISRVVSKISGQKLDVYLKSRLFDKAGFKDYTIKTCPQGYPLGATQFFLRPNDMVKLGRIYLNYGTYEGKRIFSKEWAEIVINKGYELNKSGTGYAKGGMNGQYLYINYKHNVAAAWLSKYDDNTWKLGDTLKEYMK